MILGPLLRPEAFRELPSTTVILDARAGAEAARAYARGHVPGAFRVDLERTLSAPHDPRLGGRHPLPPLERWLCDLGNWGVGPNTPVVIYDDHGGAMAAARAWWMLRAVGHSQVAVVEGGLRALETEGVPLDRQEVAPPKSASAYETTCTCWPTVDSGWIQRHLDDSEWRLLDARAPQRFRGEVEPIDPVAGHIPGAVNLHWESQLGADGRFAPAEDRLESYDRARGDVQANHIVCYCGSGVTACHLILGLEAAGVHGAQLYVGSWSEWCRLHPPP
ncbi:MAG: rhodanese-like domain-containing protein [Polyangiales bacterium]